MTWEWITFTAVICTFIAVIMGLSAWNAHKVRDDARDRNIFGSRPGVRLRSSGSSAPVRDDDE